MGEGQARGVGEMNAGNITTVLGVIWCGGVVGGGVVGGGWHDLYRSWWEHVK